LVRRCIPSGTESFFFFLSGTDYSKYAVRVITLLSTVPLNLHSFVRVYHAGEKMCTACHSRRRRERKELEAAACAPDDRKVDEAMIEGALDLLYFHRRLSSLHEVLILPPWQC
jgi:hypothetical protein